MYGSPHLNINTPIPRTRSPKRTTNSETSSKYRSRTDRLHNKPNTPKRTRTLTPTSVMIRRTSGLPDQSPRTFAFRFT
ncbi:hypothetical protein BDN67DRAFT_962675, partial [Paxillus ammoniavirescens]